MDDQDFDRRHFHQWTLAAFSGVLAGAAAGCGQPGTPAAKPVAKPDPAPAAKPAGPMISLTDEQVVLLTDEVHTCRGLNVCKGKGRSKENECAGQGTCASVADSSCGGHNDCATLGGCGATAGINECKGQGGCHVPLMDDAWKQARAAFETAMNKKELKFGSAPEPAK